MEVLNRFYLFLILFNRFRTGKIELSISDIPINTQPLNINNLITASAKYINPDTIRKRAEYCWRDVGGKAMFFLVVLKILLSECWDCLKSNSLMGLGGFEWFLKFFDFVYSFSEKLKKYWEFVKIAWKVMELQA